MNKNSKKIWEKPWGYTEGFIIAAGVAIAGLLLQLTSGNIETQLFAYPVNIIIGALFIVGLLFVYFAFKRKSLILWLSGVRSTLPALAVWLALIIILGLTPQMAGHTPESEIPQTVFGRLGWHQMTSSWTFVLTGFYVLVILGFTILRRTHQKFSLRDIGFYLNHAGLFIALLAGMLGSADMERLTMTVSEGNVEWRATDKRGNIKELPVAIELDTFMIEEYPPKLVIIEANTGKMLPDDRPDSYMFEGIGKTTTLAGNTVEILDYLPNAGIVRDSGAVSVVPILMEGATTAIKVRVTSPPQQKPAEGWVSNGSYMFPHNLVYLDDGTAVAMPVQEVKKYTSRVTVYTESGHTEKAEIEVNKPLTVQDWIIYQYSYDERKGKYSDTSVFELVRDPWIKAVYTGIFMLLAGALFIFIVGPKKHNPEIQNRKTSPPAGGL